MDGRPTWTDCDEAGDYSVPNVLSPRYLVFRPDIMDETNTHIKILKYIALTSYRTENCPVRGLNQWTSDYKSCTYPEAGFEPKNLSDY